MKTKKMSFMFLALTTFLTPKFSDASTSLACTKNMPSGQYTGHFINIIDKDGWRSTNYMFQTDDNVFSGCVQMNAGLNPTRAKIVYNAYLLGSDVELDINTNHGISGIGI